MPRLQSTAAAAATLRICAVRQVPDSGSGNWPCRYFTVGRLDSESQLN